MEFIRFLMFCAVVASVWVIATTLGHVKDRVDSGFEEIRREINDLKKAMEVRSDMQYDVVADIRDLLAGTPSESLRKRIADYKLWEKPPVEIRIDE